MKHEEKPLYALTIEEFITLTKQLIDEALKGKQQDNISAQHDNHSVEEVFTIVELSAFLRCSKVSIHNYKKLGLPFYKIGRKLLFKKAEVLNFMRGLKHKRVITG